MISLGPLHNPPHLGSFEKVPIMSFRPEGEILNNLKSLRFLIANAPRNDKIQRSQVVNHVLPQYNPLKVLGQVDGVIRENKNVVSISDKFIIRSL